MRRSSLALCLGLVACVPAAPAPDAPWVSGTRLRARLARTEDGTSLFLGWRDTELGVDCAFHSDTEGTLRCLPTATFERVLLDDACTEAGVLLGACEEAVRYTTSTVESATDPCEWHPLEQRYEVRSVGEPRVGRPHSSSGTTCSPFLEDHRVAATGALSPAIFVAAHVERAPLSERLEAEILVADDGTRERYAFFDTVLGTECLVQGGGLGASACIPSRIGYVDVIPWRAGADCGRTLVHTSVDEDAGCPAPIVALYSRQDECGHYVDLWTVGEPYDGEIFSGRDAASCQTEGDRNGFFELGAPVVEDAFVRVQRETLGTSGARVRVLVADGLVLSQDGLVSEGEQACFTMAFADGLTRCVHDVVLEGDGASYFADAACTEPLYPYTECYGSLFLLTHETSCAREVTRVRALEGVTPAAVFSDESGTCVRIDDAPDHVPQTYRGVGAELPFETFPTITLAVE